VPWYHRSLGELSLAGRLPPALRRPRQASAMLAHRVPAARSTRGGRAPVGWPRRSGPRDQAARHYSSRPRSVWPEPSGLASPARVGPRTGFSPFAEGFDLNPYSFPDLLKFSSNFGNSYLFEYFSKIHKINSVGFLNSRYIHKKYQIEQ
jgi:hypothetical protein